MTDKYVDTLIDSLLDLLHRVDCSDKVLLLQTINHLRQGQSSGTPAVPPGYKLRDFVIFEDGVRCEAVSLYDCATGEPFSAQDAFDIMEEYHKDGTGYLDPRKATVAHVTLAVKVPETDVRVAEVSS
jgi:hypothetical protein